MKRREVSTVNRQPSRQKSTMNYRKPQRYFEKSGVVNPAVSYYVPLDNVTNMDKQDIKTMVDLGRYFTIFAPRQSGKTTFFTSFCRALERDPDYVTIMLSFQDYKPLDKAAFYSMIQHAIAEQLVQRLELIRCEKLDVVQEMLHEHRLTDHIAFRTFFEQLNTTLPPKRVIMFIDEFDGIPPGELENFLTTVRELYQKYKMQNKKVLYSIGLVGIRNITKLIVGGVSPFNIADQVKLPLFSLQNIHDLYQQHTEETNQPFTEEALRAVYAETAGQPWLVNRVGTILTVNIKPETTDPITAEDVDRAIDYLLKERNSHFDNLLEKAKLYKETFVSIVFNGVDYNPDDEDQSWLEQYGLIKADHDKAQIANPIYTKRFLKAFFQASEASTDLSYTGYFTPDGLLNMEAILSDFEEYIVQIGVNAFYARQKPYEKTGQFLLTAWLYQFVQGGQGELRYEIPTGPGRMDILLTYRGHKYIIETKLNRSKLQTTLEKALDQISRKYLLTERVHEGYLVLFDLKTTVGEHYDPQRSLIRGKEIVSFLIGIRKPAA